MKAQVIPIGLKKIYDEAARKMKLVGNLRPKPSEYEAELRRRGIIQ